LQTNPLHKIKFKFIFIIFFIIFRSRINSILWQTMLLQSFCFILNFLYIKPYLILLSNFCKKYWGFVLALV
jgi:hypothetical protein